MVALQNISSDETIGAVKERLNKMDGGDLDKSVLYLNGIKLNDEKKTISDYKIGDCSLLHVQRADAPMIIFIEKPNGDILPLNVEHNTEIDDIVSRLGDAGLRMCNFELMVHGNVL